MEDEILYCDVAGLIEDIKREGIYIMISKNKKELKFWCENTPRDELIAIIQKNHETVLNHLNKYSFFDA